jgi:hypothetical protein
VRAFSPAPRHSTLSRKPCGSARTCTGGRRAAGARVRLGVPGLAGVAAYSITSAGADAGNRDASAGDHRSAQGDHCQPAGRA